MKKSILVLALSVSLFITKSQTFQWSSNYFYLPYTNGNQVCQDNDGNVYVAGEFTPSSFSGKQPFGAFVNKYSPGGGLIWTKIFQQSMRMKMAVNSKKEVLCIAFDSSGYYLRTLDQSGNELSYLSICPKINGSLINHVHGIGVDAFDNIYVMGNISENYQIGKFNLTAGTYDTRMFVAKMDKQHSVIWAISSNKGSPPEIPFQTSFYVDPLGNSYIGGDYGMAGMEMGSYSLPVSKSSAGFVSKISPVGLTEWLIQAGQNSAGFAHVNAITADIWGNVYLAGFYNKPIIIAGKNMTSDPNFNLNSFILKLNNKGNALWVKQMDGPNDDVITSLVAKENLYVYGQIQSVSSIDNVTLTSAMTPAGQANEPFIAKFDEYGNIAWWNKIDCSPMSVAKAGGIYSNVNSNDVFVTGSLKGAAYFDNHPQVTQDISMFLGKIADSEQVGLATYEKENDAVVFPNPSKGPVRLTVNGSENDECDIKIINSEGVVVKRILQKINSSQTTIELDLSYLPKGMYLINISSNSMSVVLKQVLN